MGNLKPFFLLLFVLGVYFIQPSFEAPEDTGLCGQAKPDPAKTCISIRLPWRRTPIYFCVPKEKFRYQNNCANKFASNCGNPRNDTLMIATPWECCPLMSYPDSCVHHQCPSPPYERKCQEVAADSGRHECCPSYFCEEDITPEMCHFRLLDPDCHNPPEGKKNCVGFTDDHGCCPKWQCEGDTKPGECPQEMKAKKKMAAYKPTNRSGIIQPPPQQEYHEEVESASADEAEAAPMAAMSFKGAAVRYQKRRWPVYRQRDACVGDFNCPGELKCCSDDMTVYYSDGHYLKKNKNPTSGWCTEPAKKNETETDDEEVPEVVY